MSEDEAAKIEAENRRKIAEHERKRVERQQAKRERDGYGGS